MTKKDIYETLVEINISLAADDITCWESPYCPYCMIKKLQSDIGRDIKNE